MKAIRLLFLFLVIAYNGHAQWQAGISGGFSQYRGDLTDRYFSKDITHGAFGVHVKYELTPRVLLRGAVNFAKVSGNDNFSKNESRRQRNFSFASNITEFSAVAEVHTFRLDQKRWSPYVFGGLAVYHFNPYTFDTTGQKHYLQPLGTEGQGIPGYPEKSLYSRTQLAIPFGGGLRFDISERVVLGAEVGLRKLFTDYLDDISTNYADANDLLLNRGPMAMELAFRADEVPGSQLTYPEKGVQRGGAGEKDLYFMGQIQLTFKIGSSGFASGLGWKKGGRRSGYGCPTVPL